jgi:hypothetical protein
MKIYELAHIAGSDLEIAGQANDKEYTSFIYRVSIPCVEAMREGCLDGISGRGHCIEEALEAYAKNASKYPLAINAGTDSRINLPKLQVRP